MHHSRRLAAALALIIMHLPLESRAGWDPMPAPPGPPLRSVAVVNAGFGWALDAEGGLWKYWADSGWSRKDCCFSQVATEVGGSGWLVSGDSVSRFVERGDAIFKRRLRGPGEPPGGIRMIAAVNQQVFHGLDAQGKVHTARPLASPSPAGRTRNSSEAPRAAADGREPQDQRLGTARRNPWQPLCEDCTLQRIAANESGELWGISAGPAPQVVSRWNNGVWETKATGFSEVAVGGKGSVWAIAPGGVAARWDGSTFVPTSGEFQSISVAKDGSTWAIDRSGAPWSYSDAPEPVAPPPPVVEHWRDPGKPLLDTDGREIVSANLKVEGLRISFTIQNSATGPWEVTAIFLPAEVEYGPGEEPRDAPMARRETRIYSLEVLSNIPTIHTPRDSEGNPRAAYREDAIRFEFDIASRSGRVTLPGRKSSDPETTHNFQMKDIRYKP